MFIATIFSAMGLLAVANAKSEWHAIAGIVMTSFSCGLGESSLMTYAPNFNKYALIASLFFAGKSIVIFVIIERNVISTWASGTGAAGIAGAFTYAFLLNLGFTAKSSLHLMLIIPCLEAVAFFIILRRPRNRTTTNSPQPTSQSVDETASLLSPQRGSADISAPTFREKIEYFPKLFMYILPLFAVYFCEYFINQGLVSQNPSFTSSRCIHFLFFYNVCSTN